VLSRLPIAAGRGWKPPCVGSCAGRSRPYLAARRALSNSGVASMSLTIGRSTSAGPSCVPLLPTLLRIAGMSRAQSTRGFADGSLALFRHVAKRTHFRPRRSAAAQQLLSWWGRLNAPRVHVGRDPASACFGLGRVAQQAPSLSP
jgi:hypothetical protein